MTHVVIVGAGIAGVPAAYAMRNRLSPKDKVTVISDRDYFHFVPSNPWVAMGWRNRNDIAFPIGPYLSEHEIDFIPKALKKVDGLNNQVELVDGSRLAYDYLILATGPEASFDEIEGLDPVRGVVHSVMDIEDALKAYHDYLQFVKNPGALVIGAVQNSSILGPVYEFAFLVDADLRRRNLRDRVPITILTPEPYVGHLGLGAESDTRHLLEQALAECNITCLTNVKTQKIEPGVVHVTLYDDQGRELQSSEIPFAYSAYWAAFRGIRALREDPELSDERGFVKTDEYLRSPLYPNIFAVGVCGAHPSVTQTPLPIGAPDSVYSIQNEVDVAVRNIVAAMNGEGLINSVPLRAKWINDMTESGAALLSEPHIPLRNILDLKDGKWVHLAKLSFENYFINKIKLKPAKPSISLATHIATLMRRLQSHPGTIRPDALPRAYTTALEVRMPKELNYDLQALSRTLDQDAMALAAALLESALGDARNMLYGAELDDLQRIKRELMVADLPENQPGVEFHGGGT
ncbi:MAG: FAD-dependent oxidoreductase [Pseudomonadota bacterium]|nr:FAD-dependent oxidoreductase [Pseudomonadota bacterium]